MQEDTFIATDDLDDEGPATDMADEPVLSFTELEPRDASRTTVITIGLTPPIIGGGLALGYLAVRRMGGASAPGGRGGTAGGGANIGGAASDPVGAVAETAGQVAEGAAGVAGGVVGGAASAVTGAVGGVGQTAGRVAVSIGGAAGQVRERAISAAGTVGGSATQLPRLAAQNPVLTLGIGLGIGAAIGLLVPPTRQERQLIEPASVELIGRVRTTAQQTMQKVQVVADEAGAAALQSAEEVGLIEAGQQA